MTRPERYFKVANTLMRAARLTKDSCVPNPSQVARIVATARQYVKMGRTISHRGTE